MDDFQLWTLLDVVKINQYVKVQVKLDASLWVIVVMHRLPDLLTTKVVSI